MRVLTFNVAGIPLAHPRWSERRRAIADALRASDYDLVALQEVWLDSDARFLARESAYPHALRVRKGLILGDGLVLLSRLPIVETRALSFRASPPLAFKLTQGDSLAAKGAVLARVSLPDGGELDVYNTHMIADYVGDRYLAIRQAQSLELAQFVERHSAGRPVLMLGDFNAGAEKPEYAALLDFLNLQDPCRPKASDLCGPSSAHGTDAHRIDHVLAPAGPLKASARLAFTGPVPGASFLYSDHRGVEAELAGLAALRLAPRPERQLAALRRMRSDFEEEASSRLAWIAARRWIPLYGWAVQAAYDPQIRMMEYFRARTEGLIVGRFKAN